MSLDKSKFIQTFKTEAEGFLVTLNQGLVTLEHSPDALKNAELLKELFRVAHTLKGGSGMMGFHEIQKVGHKMEDLFGLIRDGRLKFQQSVAGPVFSALDAIQAALQNIGAGKPEGIDVERICGEIEKICLGAEEKEAPPKDQPPDQSKDQKKTVAEEGPEQAAQATQVQAAPVTEDYLRVPVSRINQLLNLMGEIVINKVKSSYKMELFKKLCQQVRVVEKVLTDLGISLKETLHVPDELIFNRGNYLRASQEMESAARFFNSLYTAQSLFGSLRKDIEGATEWVQSEIFHLNPVVESLQQKMKEIRMLPCSTIFEGFPRLVRDIAVEQHKKVELVIHGAETELDKKVLEAIKGPLIHILRNAVDHGIEGGPLRLQDGKSETGTITLSAFQEGGKVIITVDDDGRGIDLDQVRAIALRKEIVREEELAAMSDQEVMNLVFADHFSTAPIVTDISGRGVGLDAVRKEMERLKGLVVLTSQKGAGTSIRLELPLTIAIVQVLLARVAGTVFAFPVMNLEESLKFTMDRVATIEGKMMIQLRGQSVPIIPLAGLLGIQGAQEESVSHEQTLVIVSSLKKRVGFMVDGLIGEEEIFLKNIGSHLGNVKGVSGATILASGEVILVLDLPALVEQAQLAHPAVQAHKKAAVKRKKKILVVEDSLTTRELEKTILENSGYRVETTIDGVDALERLSKGPVDAIVTDVQMPRMDGFELCRQVKKNSKLKDIPVIFVTSLSKEEEKRRGIDVGGNAYITKAQFDQGNLIETLERLT